MYRCIVYRNDEIPSQGVIFFSPKEAIEYIKSRAVSEGFDIKDYIIIPIEEESL